MRIFFAAVALFIAPWVALAQEPAFKTVAYESPSVGRTLKYNIVLPTAYSSTERRYPVLYLLHGFTSDYTAWVRMGVPRYAKNYDLIVVMADAGNSWYANWAESEESQKNRWEDAMVKDLVGHIDSTYRTIAKREGRAINGLSMGGYGALVLGLRNPDVFCSIGSHSGAVAFARQIGTRLRSGEALPARKPSERTNAAIDIEGFNSQVERTPKGKLFVKPEDADAHDPFKLVLTVPKEKLPHIYIDCGTEDRLLKCNQELMKLLMENKIPFTYGESGGGHAGPYWAREVGHSMAVQYAILQRNLMP